MILPSEYDRFIEGSGEIAVSLHTYIITKIIERMMLRLGRGEDYLFTAADKWQLQVLQDAGYLLEDIQEEIAKVTRLQKQEIKEAMEDAGAKALEYDHKIYEAAGLTPTLLTQSPALVRLMQRSYEATAGEWVNMTRTTAEASQRIFIQQMDKAYNLVSSGAVSYTQAVAEAIEEIAKDGVKIRYPSGHEDNIEVATLRAVRTGVAQATGDIQMARMEEMEWDIILTSAHLGARTGDGGPNPGNHLWWQGQFFSRTGKTKDLPLFKEATGYGTGEGICGWNCRHSFGPGDGVNNPFADIQMEDNYKVEQLNKQQRAKERRIRADKRELQGLKVAIDGCGDEKLKFELQQKYDRAASRLQKHNKDYEHFCKTNKLKKLDDRLKVAKWDREQAAGAREAAKRYNNVLDIRKAQSIIKERVSNGEYSLSISKQQYMKHVQGTKQFADYMSQRLLKGKIPQSRLTISEQEAAEFIKQYYGTGTIRIKRDGTVMNVEYVSSDRNIGQYYSNGKWIDTKRAAIHYGKRGSHVVPVEDKDG